MTELDAVVDDQLRIFAHIAARDVDFAEKIDIVTDVDRCRPEDEWHTVDPQSLAGGRAATAE